MRLCAPSASVLAHGPIERLARAGSSSLAMSLVDLVERSDGAPEVKQAPGGLLGKMGILLVRFQTPRQQPKHEQSVFAHVYSRLLHHESQ